MEITGLSFTNQHSHEVLLHIPLHLLCIKQLIFNCLRHFLQRYIYIYRLLLLHWESGSACSTACVWSVHLKTLCGGPFGGLDDHYSLIPQKGGVGPRGGSWDWAIQLKLEVEICLNSVFPCLSLSRIITLYFISVVTLSLGHTFTHCASTWWYFGLPSTSFSQ